ncbi:MAG TPA: hypothetical protein VLL08_30180 [Kineosporiaceae bacterium]|nr:hypothetical protein [Kineosporiaceae bacterium]
MPTNQQPPTAGVGMRWLRAVAVALAAWGTASAAHLLGGGHLPTLVMMISMILATAWPIALSLGKQASGRRIVGLLGAGQAVMHAAFVIAAAWSAPTLTSRPTVATTQTMRVHPGHHPALMDQSLPIPDGGSAAMAGTGHLMSILPSPLMVLIHLVAAGLLGGVLNAGERALFALLAHLAQLSRPAVRICCQVLRVLATLLTGPDPFPSAVVQPRWDQIGARLPEHLLVRAVGWRGPPLPGAQA